MVKYYGAKEKEGRKRVPCMIEKRAVESLDCGRGEMPRETSSMYCNEVHIPHNPFE